MKLNVLRINCKKKKNTFLFSSGFRPQEIWVVHPVEDLLSRFQIFQSDEEQLILLHEGCNISLTPESKFSK